MESEFKSLSLIQRWWLAIRPKTLPAAIAPVVLGWSIAINSGRFNLAAGLTALLIALLVQIGTNLVNDVVDFSRGADTAARTGPARVTQTGMLSPRQVWGGVIVSFGLAALAGSYLVWIAGWPALLIGLAALLAGTAYTAGPFPLAYHGLGDLFVFIFFGFAAVGGTVYVTAGSIPPITWFGAAAAGALTVNILVVNNIRDLETDRAAGRRNLPVVFGRRAAEWEYGLMLAVACAVPLVILCQGLAAPWVLLSLLSVPQGVLIWQQLRRGLAGRELNPMLGKAAQHLLVYCLLLAAGVLLSP